MKRGVLMMMAIVVGALSLEPAWAALGAPGLISYQGKLTDSAGHPITTPVTVTFHFYDAATGGNALGDGFSDVDTVTPNAEGIYSTQVGDDDQPIPQAVFDYDTVYLNVNVNGEDLNPRQRITAAGYSLNTNNVQTFTAGGPIAAGDRVSLNDAGAIRRTGYAGYDTEVPCDGTPVLHMSNAASGSPQIVRGSAGYRVVSVENSQTIMVGDPFLQAGSTVIDGVIVNRVHKLIRLDDARFFLWFSNSDYVANSSFFDHPGAETVLLRSVGSGMSIPTQGSYGVIGTIQGNAVSWGTSTMLAWDANAETSGSTGTTIFDSCIATAPNEILFLQSISAFGAWDQQTSTLLAKYGAYQIRLQITGTDIMPEPQTTAFALEHFFDGNGGDDVLDLSDWVTALLQVSSASDGHSVAIVERGTNITWNSVTREFQFSQPETKIELLDLTGSTWNVLDSKPSFNATSMNQLAPDTWLMSSGALLTADPAADTLLQTSPQTINANSRFAGYPVLNNTLFGRSTSANVDAEFQLLRMTVNPSTAAFSYDPVGPVSATNPFAGGWMLDADHVVLTNGSKARIVRLSTMQTDAAAPGRFVGIAEETVNDGDPCKVTIFGGITGQFHNLLPGHDYFIQENGTLSPASGNYIGKAMGTDKLLVLY